MVQSKLRHLIYRYLANKDTEHRSMRNIYIHKSSCMMDDNDLSNIITKNSDDFSSMMKNNRVDHSFNTETDKSDHSSMMTKSINHSSSTVTKNSNGTPSIMDGKMTFYNDDDMNHWSPSEKTRLLVNLLPHLHDCVDIMHNRSLIVQT